MKKFLKFSAVLAALILALACFAACSDGSGGSGSGGGGYNTIIPPTPEELKETITSAESIDDIKQALIDMGFTEAQATEFLGETTFDEVQGMLDDEEALDELLEDLKDYIEYIESLGGGGNSGSDDGNTVLYSSDVKINSEGTFVIADKYTEINGWAFKDLTSLTSITIPAGITKIGNGAFIGCTNLASVTFAPGSRLDEICQAAFSGCTSLTQITLPESVTKIGFTAFYDCPLDEITIPANVTVLDSVPNKCKTIKFADGSKITEYFYIDNYTSKVLIEKIENFPAGIKKIPDDMFSYCEKLESITFAPNSQLEEIGSRAFSIPGYSDRNSCPIKEIAIPASVKKIGEYAFFQCEELATVTFASGSQLEEICGSVFQSCTSLTEIELPASIKYIDDYAFKGCTALTKLTINAAEPPKRMLSSTECDFNEDALPDSVTKIFVPAGSVETYKADNGWKDLADKIKAIGSQ